MIKKLLCATLLVFAMTTIAQNSIQTEMDSILDETQANKFLETHTSNKGQVFVFNKEKHKTELAKALFSLGKGGGKVVSTELENVHYKVIDKYDVPYYRVSYVYFDGSKKSTSEIFELQQIVVKKYQQGFKFKDLAKQYSMDTNATRGGDSGWCTKGTNDPEFEAAVINSDTNLGDLFTIHTSVKDAHYVVLKTYAPKMIEEIKVLKVSEKI